MKSLVGIFAALCFAATSIDVCNAKELRMVFRVGETAVEGTLMIEGGLAVTTFGDEVEEFDLKEMKWRHGRTNQWSTLKECADWSELSRETTLKSLDKAPERIRPFLRWALDPKFESETQGDTLRLTSGSIDYLIEGKASTDQVDDYFRYAVLNAYKKALTEKKLPPFAELKAIEEMEKLGHIPGKITLTMPAIPKAPKIEVEISEKKP